MWGIAFELVEQRASDLIITAPGAYHQVLNAGATVAEAIHYADGAAAGRLAGYCQCSRTCHPGAASRRPVCLTWPESQVLVRQPTASHAGALQLPRKLAVWPIKKPLLEQQRQRLEALQRLFDGNTKKDMIVVSDLSLSLSLSFLFPCTSYN